MILQKWGMSIYSMVFLSLILVETTFTKETNLHKWQQFKVEHLYTYPREIVMPVAPRGNMFSKKSNLSHGSNTMDKIFLIIKQTLFPPWIYIRLFALQQEDFRDGSRERTFF